MDAYQELKIRFEQLAHCQHVMAICQWDEAVMMPSGSGEARAQALATLSKLQHQLLTDPYIGELLDQVEQHALPSPWDERNLCLMQRQYALANAVPADVVERAKLAFLRGEEAWRQLRPRNDWAAFMPFLADNVELAREFGHYRASVLNCELYDALIDEYSPGIRQAFVDPLFATLQRELPSMVARCQAEQVPPDRLTGDYNILHQQQLGLEVMRILGFDFKHGRLDVSHHPFCGGVPEDVRITTRYRTDEFLSAMMGICHETGHGLYELGLPEKWVNQPVGQALGMVVHESQSLFIEMQICRGLPFLHQLTPLVNRYLCSHAPITVQQMYKNYTYVNPGYIRIDADELSYPLHIIMRYEIEQQLFSGQVSIKDLPELWDDYMQRFLHLSTQDNYMLGIMQDVHWASGAFGYFPAYTLGAIFAAQLASTLREDLPDVDRDIMQGDMMPLLAWLRQKVHRQGSLLPFEALVQEATGKPLAVDVFLKHLLERYFAAC